MLYLSDINQNYSVLINLIKIRSVKFQKKNFYPVEIVLIHVGGLIDGWRRTDLLKLTVAFHSFLDWPKNKLVVKWRVEHQGDDDDHHHHHPLSFLHSSSAGSQKCRVLTNQALLIHSFAIKFLTIQHILSITSFCIRMYRSEQRLSIFTLSRNLEYYPLWIVPVVFCRPFSVAEFT
jgi:hypothetical protein